MNSNSIIPNSFLEPCLGMEFDSHEHAYSFYRDYAKSMGFGTSKLSSRRSRASKEFIDAKFSCMRYGNKQQSDDAINPRPSPKIGCKASMHVKRKHNGKWYVYSFVKDHNHDLLPSQVHLFRSHRNIDPLKNDVKIRKRKNSAAISKLFSAYQNVDCLENFVRNQHDKGRTLALESGDAHILLELFMHMQQENPKFFYAVDMNEEHQLRNVFWVDGKGMEDYAHFGDVVSFDTTYFTNKYKLPLVLFIGVNHHIQHTLLGCALIADDTLYTYLWLMQTWYIAMGERSPKVILTDQNTSMKAVIEAVLPGTRHYFSLWYILEKIPKELEFLSMWHENFMEKFKKCVFKSWTKEEFEKRWQKLLDKFNLREVEWMQHLYRNNIVGVPSRSDVGPRIPRKKAPSGTACEKHKRWKKRCPDDCPMRKAKTRRSGKMTRSQSMELKYDYYQDYEEQGSPLSTGEADTFSELSEDKNLYSRRNYEATPSYSENRGPSKSELLSLISWSMQQLSQDSNLSQDDIYVIQAQLTKKTNVVGDANNDILDILESCKQQVSYVSTPITTATSPAHVITIGPKQSTIKEKRGSGKQQNMYYDNSISLSPSSSMEDLSPGSFTAEEDIYGKYEADFEKSPRTQKNMSTEKKSPKTPRAKGTRKYLPQACERHKLLHAKCPANCPDRLKRDAERALSTL